MSSSNEPVYTLAEGQCYLSPILMHTNIPILSHLPHRVMHGPMKLTSRLPHGERLDGAALRQ